MLKKILGMVALVLVMTAALVVYSLKGTAPDTSAATGTVDGYKQQFFAKTKEVVAPVLKKACFDVEKVESTADLNVVKKQMQNASDKVNEATTTLNQ